MHTADIQRLGMNEEPTTDKVWKAWIVWGSIIGIALLCSLSSCSMTPARAEGITLTASYYSTASLKKEGTYAYSRGIMANGDIFNENNLTCANRLFPLGSYLRVTNLESGKAVIVQTTDRIGKRFATKRIDLSKGAFNQIAPLKQGLVLVKVELLGRAK